MSDYIESLFQGVDMLIDKKLGNLNYDTTIICTITDNSDSKNGKYRVTDGSIAFTAYSDVSTYRSGEQVRVNVPQGDMTKKKFIIGKYLSDDNNSALTYVSPLNSVINITGNLFDLPEPPPGYWGILANGPNTTAKLWEDNLDLRQYGDLQANGIYNILIIKAEFKTDLYNYNYINGTYGLRVELDVRPTPDSTAKYTKVVELSSKEMFGNPYNFTIFAPQAKVFNVVSAGVIEKIKLSLYQNNDFVNDRKERIVPKAGTPDNIFVKNIEIGLGSNVLDVEDNTVRIYSKEGTNYSPEDYKRSLNLVWYNKDENNQSIGFEDQQINDKLYNEFDYLQLVNLDQRLLNQQGKENVNNDKMSLMLSADKEDIITLFEKIAYKFSNDCCSEINATIERSNSKELIDELSNKKELCIEYADEVFPEFQAGLTGQYDSIIQYIYQYQECSNTNTIKNLEKPVIVNLSILLTLFKNDLKNKLNIFNSFEGHVEIINIYNYQINKILDDIILLINKCIEITDKAGEIQAFIDKLEKSLQEENIQSLQSYQQTDLSLYDNQYDIYWYRYEEKYEAPDTEYKLMPNGWKIYETEGKITLADKCSISGIELDPTLDQEKFIALVIYNHEIYKSNELVFNNTNPLPTQQETDATDTLRIEHIDSSFNTYYVYDSTHNLKDALDEGKNREIRCHYDGLRHKDDILKGATIHWYIPTDDTMLTYDQDFLEGMEGKGFTCPDKQTKPGYIEFYKTINQILKSTLREDQYDSWGEKGFTLVEGDNAYDDRSFWYKIKPQLDTGFTNNDIICRIVLATDTKEVETKELFFFGLTGNTGTKYTFNIYNGKEKNSFVPKDKNTDPLKLSIELRDPTYKQINFEENPKVNWLGYKNIDNNDYQFDNNKNNDISVEGKNIELQEQFISGIIIGETNIDYFHPLKKDSETGLDTSELDTGKDAKLNNTNNPLPVALSCLYPVPYSISEDYVLDGPINIIYDNFGVLNSKMNYDTHYQLKNKNNDTLVTSHEGQPIQWDINYGIVRVNIDDNKRVTPVKNQALTIQSVPEDNKDKDFYAKYAPTLTKDRRLQPSPIYLSDLYMIPFVEAYIIDDSDQKVIIYSQPIIIKQDKYPSEFLNEWNGGYYVDDKAGLIMSSMVGAGRKNFTNNTFDGILMGEVEKQAGMKAMKDNLGEGTHSGLGLYGFHDGEQSFGFNIDGSAFIGKASKGRIMFDGNNGFIASANWFTGEGDNTTHPDYSVDNPYPYGGKIGTDGSISKSSNAGMCIDLQQGHIDAYDFKLSSENIYLNSNPAMGESVTDYFLKIGDETKGEYISFDNKGKLRFQVNEFYLTGNLGGINLLQQTAYLPEDASKWVWKPQTATLSIYSESGKNNYLKLGPKENTSDGWMFQKINVENGKTYTLSGYIRHSPESYGPKARFNLLYRNDEGKLPQLNIIGKHCQNGTMQSNGFIPNNHTQVWEYFEYTFEVQDANAESATEIVFYITSQCNVGNGGSSQRTVNLDLWHLKLEEGVYVSQWSSTPEDIEHQMNDQITTGINNFDASKTQTEIFNKLFDGVNGISLATDPTTRQKRLYISATYISTGYLRSSNITSDHAFSINDMITINDVIYYDCPKVYDTTTFDELTSGMWIDLDENIIWTPKFKVRADGTMIASGGAFSGRINTTSGTIGGWKITSSSIEQEFSTYKAYIQAPRDLENGVEPWIFSVQYEHNKSLYSSFHVDRQGNLKCRKLHAISPKKSSSSSESERIKFDFGDPWDNNTDRWIAFCSENLKAGGNENTYPEGEPALREGIIGYGGFLIQGGGNHRTAALWLRGSSVQIDDPLSVRKGMTVAYLATFNGGLTVNSGATFNEGLTVKTYSAQFKGGANVSSGLTLSFLNNGSAEWSLLGVYRATGTVTTVSMSSSLRRFKENISQNFDTNLDPKRLYDLPIVQFNFTKKALEEVRPLYHNLQVGLIAEDVQQYFPSACTYDHRGELEGWAERLLVPAMLKLIQDQKKDIDQLYLECQNLKKLLNGEKGE